MSSSKVVKREEIRVIEREVVSNVANQSLVSGNYLNFILFGSKTTLSLVQAEDEETQSDSSRSREPSLVPTTPEPATTSRRESGRWLTNLPTGNMVDEEKWSRVMEAFGRQDEGFTTGQSSGHETSPEQQRVGESIIVTRQAKNEIKEIERELRRDHHGGTMKVFSDHELIERRRSVVKSQLRNFRLFDATMGDPHTDLRSHDDEVALRRQSKMRSLRTRKRTNTGASPIDEKMAAIKIMYNLCAAGLPIAPLQAVHNKLRFGIDGVEAFSDLEIKLMLNDFLDEDRAGLSYERFVSMCLYWASANGPDCSSKAKSSTMGSSGYRLLGRVSYGLYERTYSEPLMKHLPARQFSAPSTAW
eukprot:m.221864 g.221864  ORF g.221864 m.221864 type:complete len:359 (-) comp10663_c0_seq1:360-1436(-)